MRVKLNKFHQFINRWLITLKNYRLIFSLSNYWNELARLNWWLLMEDEALAMPEQVSNEYDKLLILIEIATLSKQHEKLMGEFLAFGMLGHSRPLSPISRNT